MLIVGKIRRFKIVAKIARLATWNKKIFTTENNINYIPLCFKRHIFLITRLMSQKHMFPFIRAAKAKAYSAHFFKGCYGRPRKGTCNSSGVKLYDVKNIILTRSRVVFYVFILLGVKRNGPPRRCNRHGRSRRRM